MDEWWYLRPLWPVLHAAYLRKKLFILLSKFIKLETILFLFLLYDSLLVLRYLIRLIRINIKVLYKLIFSAASLRVCLLRYYFFLIFEVELYLFTNALEIVCTEIVILEWFYFNEMIKEMNVILKVFYKCH